MFQSVTAP